MEWRVAVVSPAGAQDTKATCSLEGLSCGGHCGLMWAQSTVVQATGITHSVAAGGHRRPSNSKGSCSCWDLIHA